MLLQTSNIGYVILAFVVILAISTLGIDISILTSSMTIIVASAGLAVALTFGLGSRETARNVIAGYSVQQRLSPGQEVTFGNYSGTIRATSGAYTVVEVQNEQGDLEDVFVPSSMLLQRIIRVKRNSGGSTQDTTTSA